jgi:signal peptidase II
VDGHDTPALPPVTEAGPVAAGERRARPHWFVFFGLAVGILVVDQIVKALVVANFSVGVAVDLIGEYLRITITHNTGALFGMFRDQAGLFALFSLGVIAIIVWYEAYAGRSLLLTIALGLLLGGALGNFADRIRLGYVVDFVDMGIGGWRFYTYNVADSAITVSILLLIGIAFLPALSSGASDA